MPSATIFRKIDAYSFEEAKIIANEILKGYSSSVFIEDNHMPDDQPSIKT